MTPIGELAGQTGLSAVDNSSATQWYARTGVDSSTPEDNVSFQIYIEDFAGNSRVETHTSDNSSVQVDTLPPVISEVSISSTNVDQNLGKYGDNVTLFLKLLEPIKNLDPGLISINEVSGITITNKDNASKEWEISGSVNLYSFGEATFNFNLSLIHI